MSIHLAMRPVRRMVQCEGIVSLAMPCLAQEFWQRETMKGEGGGGGGGEVVKGSNIQQTLGKKEINCLLAEAIKLPLVKIYCLGKEVISIEPEAI